jgi:YbgC/YbaW family acyl-CoA thioester hydrolase
MPTRPLRCTLRSNFHEGLSMPLTDYRCQSRLRVRWAEIDMQRIVFNAHYLTYFDTAMTDYWRALALPYDDAMQQLGGEMYLKKATLEYHASAREGDMLTIGMRCLRVGNTSALFDGGIFRGEQLLVSGELIYVFADPANQRPTSVPALLRELFSGFETGESPTQIQLGAWQELGERATRVRQAVFVEEQGIAPDIEMDGQDATALHALVTNRLDQPVATGRLVTLSPGVSRIGRMAVHRALRGGRLGRQMLDALVHAAAKRGDHQVVLHAQASAQPFYERAGFEVSGPRYEEAGLPHVPMQRLLTTSRL